MDMILNKNYLEIPTLQLFKEGGKYKKELLGQMLSFLEVAGAQNPAKALLQFPIMGEIRKSTANRHIYFIDIHNHIVIQPLILTSKGVEQAPELRALHILEEPLSMTTVTVPSNNTVIVVKEKNPNRIPGVSIEDYSGALEDLPDDQAWGVAARKEPYTDTNSMGINTMENAMINKLDNDRAIRSMQAYPGLSRVASELIKIAYAAPELRGELLPIIMKASSTQHFEYEVKQETKVPVEATGNKGAYTIPKGTYKVTQSPHKSNMKDIHSKEGKPMGNSVAMWWIKEQEDKGTWKEIGFHMKSANENHTTWGRVIDSVKAQDQELAENIESDMHKYHKHEHDVLAVIQGYKLYHGPYDKNAPKHYRDLPKNIKL